MKTIKPVMFAALLGLPLVIGSAMAQSTTTTSGTQGATTGSTYNTDSGKMPSNHSDATGEKPGSNGGPSSGMGK